MYDLVAEMTPDRLYELSKRAFDEMLSAGITCVGEFHYLRHLSENGLDFAGDDCVLAAAADAGIRIVLLAVYYETGGIGQPLSAPQRRFATPDLGTYWRQMERLGGRLKGPDQTLGVAPHSIRAVPRDTLKELHAEARRQGFPTHMHLEEQPREIEDCRAAYGQSPMEIVLELAGNDHDLHGFTAVHCTHTPAEQLERFFAAGGKACICPLTEGNLGDGLPQLAELPGVEQHLCLGTDSNLRISMLEEMRWLEYGQRVRRQQRGSIAGDNGNHLLEIATQGGAKSLQAKGAGPLTRAPIETSVTTVAESTWIYSVGEEAVRTASYEVPATPNE
jgi:formimidoylglutamate deiminase